MIAKIMKGSGFKGVINYILDSDKGTELIDSCGVRIDTNNHIIQIFIDQTALNPKVCKTVGHISLSFSAQDLLKLSNEFMVKIAREYMERMGIKDTQYIVGRHFDKEHPHVHIVFNRVDNNGKTISDKNDRFRSEKICKELTAKYDLYFTTGKEKVKEHRLKEPDKTRYELYKLLSIETKKCRDWKSLIARLKQKKVDVRFKYKGNTQEVQGVIFDMNEYHFNGSKIDRAFSFSKIDYALAQNNKEVEQQKQNIAEALTETSGTVSDMANDFIEGTIDLFHSYGTVPGSVYNTLDRKKKKKKRKI
ncbi:relaxase/mobilization nuclease domain-containing protein [Prevotella aurantiaca]